jgi:hypothetical protein
MASKPILFSTPMVKAILDGREKCTRRVVKPQPPQFVDYFEKRGDGFKAYMVPGEPCDYPLVKPKYQPGDILWVRETWATVSSGIIEYKATYIEPYTGSTEIDHIGKKITWRPSIHMPRTAARIFLRVTNVRVERVQEITENDAKNEGVKDPYDYQEPSYYDQPHVRGMEINKSAFAGLWDSLNAKRGYGWGTNPWVWVYEFERVSEDGSSKDE